MKTEGIYRLVRMKRRRNSDSSHKHQGVRTVEKTASGKFMVRARKRKIPEKEHEKTVDSIDEGIARLAKLDKLYLRKVAVPLSCSSAGRASASQAECRRFESDQPLQTHCRIRRTMKLLKSVWVVLCALLGGAAGALFLWLKFSSFPLVLVGAVIGLLVGRLVGKYIPIHEWFS